MKRLILLTAFAATACASGPNGAGPRLKPIANPSAVIAAELAFARLAQDKGQWTAFRETAANDAEMFVPQRVAAQNWLKGRPDPAAAVSWQAHAVWSSCDGSYAVTQGSWQSANATGTYATVWQRQGNGKHKWLLDMSFTSAAPTPSPEMITARTADCSGAAIPQPTNSDTGDRKVGSATDGSLLWISTTRPDGIRRLNVVIRENGVPREVLDIATPGGPRG